MSDHSVRNRKIPYLCMASEPSIITADIVGKSDTFDQFVVWSRGRDLISSGNTPAHTGSP